MTNSLCYPDAMDTEIDRGWGFITVQEPTQQDTTALIFPSYGPSWDRILPLRSTTFTNILVPSRHWVEYYNEYINNPPLITSQAPSDPRTVMSHTVALFPSDIAAPEERPNDSALLGMESTWSDSDSSLFSFSSDGSGEEHHGVFDHASYIMNNSDLYNSESYSNVDNNFSMNNSDACDYDADSDIDNVLVNMSKRKTKIKAKTKIKIKTKNRNKRRREYNDNESLCRQVLSGVRTNNNRHKRLGKISVLQAIARKLDGRPEFLRYRVYRPSLLSRELKCVRIGLRAELWAEKHEGLGVPVDFDTADENDDVFDTRGGVKFCLKCMGPCRWTGVMMNMV